MTPTVAVPSQFHGITVIHIPTHFQSSTSFPFPYAPSISIHIPSRQRKGKGSPYSITERRVPELIPVLGITFRRPAVTPAILKRAATNFATW